MVGATAGAGNGREMACWRWSAARQSPLQGSGSITAQDAPCRILQQLGTGHRATICGSPGEIGEHPLRSGGRPLGKTTHSSSRAAPSEPRTWPHRIKLQKREADDLGITGPKSAQTDRAPCDAIFYRGCCSASNGELQFFGGYFPQKQHQTHAL